MKKLNKIFFQGLVTLLPLAATVYIIYSGVFILDNMLGNLIRIIIPPSAYVPGLGFLATLVLIFLFGLLLNYYVAGNILSVLEQKLLKVPFIKAIYSPLKDLMNLFSKNDSKSPQQVVLVKIPGTSFQSIGVVTRATFEDLSFYNKIEGRVAVYIPFSYALGGYTVLIPKEDLIEIDIPIEKAMSLAITGWVKAQKNENQT